MFNVGDYVTRKSYNNDIIFKIIDIKGDIYYLKGVKMIRRQIVLGHQLMNIEI